MLAISRNIFNSPPVVVDAMRIPKKEPTLVAACPAMRGVERSIEKLKRQNINVLITGESGTGKEIVARAIHNGGRRGNGRFLAINCAAIPEALLESELFGHERGAFSGADKRRIGKFEECDGGTILLDEIGDMPLFLQAKMLRLLQDQTFERLGGNETIRTNVRLIAATHHDLKSLAADGRFRQDLYYRLNTFTIHLPPLRDRGEDLLVLAQQCLETYAEEMGQSVVAFSNDAIERLRQHTWPGNIRELQSVVQQAILACNGNVIEADDLPKLEMLLCPPSEQKAIGCLDFASFLSARLMPGASDLYAELHREVDRRSLCEVLNYAGGNQQIAAQLLGIARQTLRIKMREAGISVKTSACTEPRNL